MPMLKPFSIFENMSASWQLVKGAKWPIILGTIINFICKFLGAIPLLGLILLIPALIVYARSDPVFNRTHLVSSILIY